MGNTIASKETASDKIQILEEHEHSIQRVWPAAADSISLIATETPWEHGAIAEIIEAGVEARPFDIRGVSLSGFSVNAEYEVTIYSGPPGSEQTVGSAPAARDAVQSQNGNTTMMTPIIPSGTRVSASVASGSDKMDTVNIKLLGHNH